jgi:thioredoxin-dependent peroxiredoxin
VEIREESAMINEGDRAPALSVTSSDDRAVDLSSPGEPLVLYFYLKDRNG